MVLTEQLGVLCISDYNRASQTTTVPRVRRIQIMSNSEKLLNVHLGLKAPFKSDLWQGSGHASSKSGTFSILSWRSLRKQQKGEGHLTFHPTPPSFLKQVNKLPCREYHPCTRRREDNLLTKDGQVRAEKRTHRDLVKLTLTFPVTSSPFTTPSANPFVLSPLYKFISHCPKDFKAFCSGHFHFLCGFSGTHKNSTKCVCFYFVHLSSSF